MKTFILISLPLLSLYPTDISAQGLDWNNLNVVVGAEYNGMQIRSVGYINNTQKTFQRVDDEFGLQPRMEINYEFNLTNTLDLNPFVSYSNRGRSETITRDEYVYEDHYETSLPTLSIGSKLFYKITNFKIGPVLALNHHIGKQKGRGYNAADEVDIKDYSMDMGVAIRYTLNEHFFLEANGMYGITNLHKEPSITLRVGGPEFDEMHLFYTNFSLGFSL